MSGDWLDVDPKKCYANKPANLFLTTQNAHDGMTQSTSEWCKSCYNLYNRLCRQVAAAFTPTLKINEKLEFDVDDFTNAVDEIVNESESMPDKDLVERCSKILEAIIECVNARRFQHQNCYSHNLLYKDRGILRGDVAHESFIVALGQGFYKLRTLYNLSLTSMNAKRNLKKLSPISSILDAEANTNTVTVLNHYVKIIGPFAPQTERKTHLKQKFLKSFKNLRVKQRKAKRSSQKKAKYRAVLPPYEKVKSILENWTPGS
jgi:hypothetical protein